jgi:hypothetical protein
VIGRAAFLSARLLASAIFLLTWAYGVTTRSAFAFDMFVKPQLSPALVSFVHWHPALFALAYLLSTLTLVPIFRTPADSTRRRAARAAAAAYVLVLGAVTFWLSGRPYLASLAAGDRGLLVVPGALLPVLWLALVDHLTAARREPAPESRTLNLQTLFRAGIATPIVLWATHAVWYWSAAAQSAGVAARTAGALWGLLLDVAAAQVIYLVLVLASTVGRRRDRSIEYMLAVVVTAVGIAEFVRRIVLPPLAFTDADRAVVALPFGVAMALWWSGLRVSGSANPRNGAFGLFATTAGRAAVRISLVAVTLMAAIYATGQVERFDWGHILRQTIAVSEAIVVFALLLPLAAEGSGRQWTMAPLVVPPLVILAALHLAPRVASASDSLRTIADPQAGIELAIARDPLARVASSAFISRQPVNSAFFRTMLDDETSLWSVSPAVPADAIMPISRPAWAPNVFVIVLDSLRRDYLSPYNPAVTFTPSIDRWASGSFIFRNAFTPYGGTAQAMPALWAGRSVPRGWGHIIKEINNLEHLITTVGFDFLINDHTIREHLSDATPRTFINPYVASVNTDLCQNFDAVIAHLRSRQSTRPVFTFLAPMNVHILNTLAGKGPAYPGFHSPSAAQLERADACFGNFIDFLTDAGIYDDSIIVLTSDHGDSLGEGGRWGHQSYLFPEVVRIPLIISVPSRLKSTITTDLSRVTFLTDVTPTLTSLVAGSGRDGDPPDGGVLFQPAGSDLRSRRRRDFMLMSSYGPAFGVIRRDGREMYLTDLRDWQEHAFQLGPVWYEEVPVTAPFRQVSQAALLKEIARVKSLYGKQP